MARARQRDTRPLPPPLPPGERTVGQVVAEAIRLYGRTFWRALPLGLPLAVADVLAQGASRAVQMLVLLAFAPIFSVAYAAATALADGRRPDRRAVLSAVVTGTLVFAPAAFFFPWFAIAAVAWLALVGLAVPAALLERLGVVAAVRRALALSRADYVHAAGSLAALLVVFAVTRLALAFVLRSQADNTIRVAVFLADLVVSPVLFLGAALLYFDQAARIGSRGQPTRRNDADLPDAHHAHRQGRADAQGESGPPA